VFSDGRASRQDLAPHAGECVADDGGRNTDARDGRIGCDSRARHQQRAALLEDNELLHRDGPVERDAVFRIRLKVRRLVIGWQRTGPSRSIITFAPLSFGGNLLLQQATLDQLLLLPLEELTLSLGRQVLERKSLIASVFHSTKCPPQL
jgi:hypothetical protein